MSHTVWEVLSVWWVVVLVDLSVVYCFLKIASDKKSKPEGYSSDVKISEKLIP